MHFTPLIKDYIDELQERFPVAFPKKPLPKVALSIGIAKVVQAVLDVNYRTADTILYYWCQGRRYNEACTVGAPRYNINGIVVGHVTPQQIAWYPRQHKV